MFGGLKSAFKKVSNAGRSLYRAGSSLLPTPVRPANTPTAATEALEEASAPTANIPAHLQAQLQSAQIIETLVQIYGGPQENNRLEISEDSSPSSKFDNVLKTSSLLETQSEFVDSVVTPINGLYGIVLRPTPGIMSRRDLEASTLGDNLRSIENSVWGAIVATAQGIAETFDADEAALSIDVLKFPQYYVFIFANTSPDSPIPVLLREGEVLEYENITSYPKGVITDAKLREETLQPGTLIRVEYDGVDNKSVPVITEVVENKPEFTRMVMNSIKNRSGFLSIVECSTDSALNGVSHATGDALGTSEPADEEPQQSDPAEEEPQQSEPA